MNRIILIRDHSESAARVRAWTEHGIALVGVPLVNLTSPYSDGSRLYAFQMWESIL